MWKINKGERLMEIDKAYLVILVLSNVAIFYYSRNLAIADVMDFFDRHKFFSDSDKENY
tara:strand:+ start:473 stop:649 length:177 start_codon:yes stop_codon:yes gene_type:complete